MRLLVALAISSVPFFAGAGGALIGLASCQDSSPPLPDSAGGSYTPTADGSVCQCASPDCLPNCSALPACSLVCSTELGPDGGGALLFVDPCGNIQYTEACPLGCGDGGTATCR